MKNVWEEGVEMIPALKNEIGFFEESVVNSHLHAFSPVRQFGGVCALLPVGCCYAVKINYMV